MSSREKRITASGEVRWVARYRDPAGRSREKWLRTKHEADRFLNEQQARVWKGTWTNPSAGQIQLAEWLDRWVRGQVGLRAKTIASYESLVRRISDGIGRLPLLRLDEQCIREWLRDLEDQGLVLLSRFCQSQASTSRSGPPALPMGRPGWIRIGQEMLVLMGPDGDSGVECDEVVARVIRVGTGRIADNGWDMALMQGYRPKSNRVDVRPYS